MNPDHVQDSLAEWSKALAPGASPQGRGFEPHSCHLVYACLFLFCVHGGRVLPAWCAACLRGSQRGMWRARGARSGGAWKTEAGAT